MSAISSVINIAILSNFLIIDIIKPNTKNPIIILANIGSPATNNIRFSIIAIQKIMVLHLPLQYHF